MRLMQCLRLIAAASCACASTTCTDPLDALPTGPSDLTAGIVWLTPAVNVRYGRPRDLILAGRTQVSGWKYDVVDVTIGVKID